MVEHHDVEDGGASEKHGRGVQVSDDSAHVHPSREHVFGTGSYFESHVPGLHWKTGDLPGWLRETTGENRWSVTVGILIAVGLQIVLPDQYALKPKLLLPLLSVAMLIVLVIVNPRRLQREHRLIRAGSLSLTLLVAVANFGSIARLVNQILHHKAGGPALDAVPLLGSGVAIWITNVIVFALWYWEFDRGGPFARAAARRPHPDFLFPQMTDPAKARPDWEPTFVDYAYLSFTNSTAFSPTDTMPLTNWAKLTMMVQSLVSLVTLALVAARAVNILP